MKLKFIIDQRTRQVLKANNLLGFDSCEQAAEAILTHDDWTERWDIENGHQEDALILWKAGTMIRNAIKVNEITNILGVYYRAAETPEFVYFCNYEESDDNGNVIMFRQSGELVSNNYFANVGLTQDIVEDRITWSSEELARSIPDIKKSNN
jgi:hypothetical protein